MRYQFTLHALSAIQEREIRPEWVERTVDDPELREPDPLDPELERRFRRIPEFGNRTLRVVVNVRQTPHRIISVFFDRKRRPIP